MKIRFFTAPKEYENYIFWRSCHHEKAIYVMLGAAVYALGSYLCS